jgi:hypothetical protein
MVCTGLPHTKDSLHTVEIPHSSSLFEKRVISKQITCGVEEHPYSALKSIILYYFGAW